MTRYLAILFFLFASSAHAAEPFKRMGTYYIDFTGIPVGKLWVSVSFDGQRCDAQAVLKTTGVVSIFDDMKSFTRASALYQNGTWQPLEFFKKEDDAQKADIVDLAFSPSGELIKRQLSHDDDPNYRPRVPKEDVQGAWHLGMVLCALGDQMNQQSVGSTESYRMYDGKRYYTVKNKRVNDNKFSLTRELINGFTHKEEKRFAEGEPPILLRHIPGEPIPRELSVPLGIGTISATYESEM